MRTAPPRARARRGSCARSYSRRPAQSPSSTAAPSADAERDCRPARLPVRPRATRHSRMRRPPPRAAWSRGRQQSWRRGRLRTGSAAADPNAARRRACRADPLPNASAHRSAGREAPSSPTPRSRAPLPPPRTRRAQCARAPPHVRPSPAPVQSPMISRRGRRASPRARPQLPGVPARRLG